MPPRHIKLVATFFLTSIVASPCRAQELHALRTENYRISLRELRSGPFRPPTSSWQAQQMTNAPPTKLDPRLGKSFWITWGLAIGFSVASTELTAHCVHIPGCSETNPVWGSKPTRLELYTIKGGIDGLGFYFSRKWKLDKNGDSWGWKYLAYGVLAANGVDTAWDAGVVALTDRPKSSARRHDVLDHFSDTP